MTTTLRRLKRNLGALDKSEQLLFRVLGSTGMRLSRRRSRSTARRPNAACATSSSGHKTEQSERRVPLPAGLLPYLPKTIKGKLFAGRANEASKSLESNFLRDCGITDPRKVLHSLRHRAQDRLRAFECPQDMRWARAGPRGKERGRGLRQRLLGAATEKMD